MALRKVEGYAVVEKEIPVKTLGEALGLLLGVMPERRYELRLDLDDGGKFFMYNVDADIAEALKHPSRESCRNIYDVLWNISENGMNPLMRAAVKCVGMTAENRKPCNLSKILQQSGKRQYGKPVDMAFCPVSCHDIGLDGKYSAELVLCDGSAVQLSDPAQGIYAGALYGCDMEMNRKVVRDLSILTTPCDRMNPTSSSVGSAILDLEKGSSSPLVSGFDGFMRDFLSFYRHISRSHTIDTEKVPHDIGLVVPVVLRYMVAKGCGLDRVNINGIDESGCYLADAVTGAEKLRVVPSHAFFISRVAGKEAFVDDELVKKQE